MGHYLLAFYLEPLENNSPEYFFDIIEYKRLCVTLDFIVQCGKHYIF